MMNRSSSLCFFVSIVSSCPEKPRGMQAVRVTSVTEAMTSSRESINKNMNDLEMFVNCSRSAMCCEVANFAQELTIGSPRRALRGGTS